MKRIKDITILALSLFLTASCSLDTFPVDKISSGDMRSADNAATATAGVYSLLKNPFEYPDFQIVGKSYINHYTKLAEYKSDNILMSGKSADPLFSDAILTDMAADGNKEYFWLVSYAINYSASVVISVIPDDSEDAELRHIKGENHFLRAFSHMNLIQLFSFPYTKSPDEPGVVIRTGPASSAEPVIRSTVGEVYAQVESDLKAAIKLMEGGTRRGDNGYVDVNAAKALLCRLYLYENRNDECIALANELLGSDPISHLESDYEYLFQNTRTSKEVLWCVALNNNDSDYPDVQASIGSMYYAYKIDLPGDGGDPGDGSGWAEIYWSQPLMDLFARYPQDQRIAKMLVKAHASKDGAKMIYWPVVNRDGFAENYIDRQPVFDSASGKWTCKDKDGKKHTVETEIVDTYPKTYIELDGQKQYVTVSDSMGCRIGTGGDMYPLNYMKKFSNQGGTISNLASPAVLRYAEILLDRAEAYAHKGNVDEALRDVNVIRKRACLPEAAMFSATNMKERGYSDVLDVVLDERRLELCFEGFRTYDLQRNNKPMDRRYAGRQPYEIVQPYDYRLRYLIPLTEVTVSGIPQNER